MRRYIYDQEKKWFFRIEPFLYGKVLKVGSGLGYMTSFVRERHPDLKILEIEINKDDKNKNRTVLYDGNHFPFSNKIFDCSICTYVLHHTPNPVGLILEMKRVSRRLIVLEETYRGVFSKMDLCYRDIYVNTLAGQPSRIFWNSYFQDKELLKVLKGMDLEIIHSQKEKKRTYFKILYVLE
ncbi:MAG: Methyltransferase type 11 [Candidatus Woesebacteria bacterium GW2011_GWB1_45_5]|uniref:Methyltransferase type 11 n=1 Tax=Candidatus Woesebacteria bacterium GW2011_GWB1_45_5 TaxID=1618581 RepID=A0A0G1MPQ3_9BACT|nr:MAG: Methyltransferase type 11 [Candidatus Woesebacteria bacterium GW2011_GWB1_45_5]